MIPFGTFVQATGSMPAAGSGGTGTGNSATVNSGLAQDASAQAGGEASDSFPAWIRKLTGDDATAASDGEIQDQLQNESTESETAELKALDWDQLTSMIAEAIEQSAELPDDSQLVDGIDISDIQDALQQLTGDDLFAGENPSLQALANLVMDMAPADGSGRIVDLRVQPMAVVQEMIGDGQEGQARGQWATTLNTLAEGSAGSDKAVAMEQGLETGQLAHTRDEVKTVEFNQALLAEKNKEKPVSPVESSAVPVDETADEENSEAKTQRIGDGVNRALRTDNPGSSQKENQQLRESMLPAGGKTGQDSSSLDENSSDSRRAVRSEIQDKSQSADVGEKELPQAASSSEPVKTAGTESNRFADTIQDAARTMTEKSSAVQAAPSERTEASAAQRFQATVMDQIVDKASLRNIQGRSEIQIRLKPEFLGNVQMNIAADKEQLVVRMVTDQPVVKEIVEANLHHLKTELQHQGLTVDRFEVVVNPDAEQQHNRGQFAQMFKHSSSQNGRRRDSDQEPETEHRENSGRKDDQPTGAKTDGVNYFA